MPNLLKQIKSWFKPKIKPKKTLKIIKTEPEIKVCRRDITTFNLKPYRKLIGKLAAQAIAIQRSRRRRKACLTS